MQKLIETHLILQIFTDLLIIIQFIYIFLKFDLKIFFSLFTYFLHIRGMVTGIAFIIDSSLSIEFSGIEFLRIFVESYL